MLAIHFVLLLWASLVIIPFILFLKNPEKFFVLLLIMVFLGWFPAAVVTIVISEPVDYTEENTFDIWYTDAPFGTYWVKESGRGSFIHFRITSDLRETYTVKILRNDNKLETFHYDTDEIEVYLLDTNDSMYLTYKIDYFGFKSDYLDYGELNMKKPYDVKIYLPNPDLFGD